MALEAQGLGVSPGIAVGRAWLLRAEPLPIVPTAIPPEEIGAEVERFHRARQQAHRELDGLRRQVMQAAGQTFAGILDAQQLILDDPGLVEATVQRIEQGGVSARWALKEVVADFTRRFENLDDPYLRERGGELADVHRRLQRLLRGEREPPNAATASGPVVVVAHTLGPSDAAQLASSHVTGLATDMGGRTSHTAILAQALGLPAVVGLRDFSRRVRPDELLVLDGETGLIVVGASPAAVARAEALERERADRERRFTSVHDLPAVTRDGHLIVLRSNIEFPDEVAQARRLGSQGIGLFRSEFLFLRRAPMLPTEEEHFATYSNLAEQVGSDPVVVRTLDLGGEKYAPGLLESVGHYPSLGLRGIRLCLQRPDLFLPQLRALLRVGARCGNLRVMLPLVTQAAEVEAVRSLLAREARDLEAQGVAVRADLPLGIMIEVPAAAMAADVLLRQVEFCSLGTNDLVQYALAVDRGNEALAHHYDPCHPGILRMIQAVVGSATRLDVPIASCGEMAGDPTGARLLIGLGLRELSVQPRALTSIRDAVRGIDSAQARHEVELLLQGHRLDDGCRIESTP